MPLDPDVVRMLVVGEREGAERALGVRLPAEFPSEDERDGFLRIQLQRMEQLPSGRSWLARLMITRSGEVVGHCGFHGPPSAIGRAEIGYTVFAEFRGRGYAKEAASGLAEWAFEQGQAEVFASVSPHNAPSLAVVRALGFEQVGVQEDDVDGTELVFALKPPGSHVDTRR